jgi:endonuclease/exonuclease/phosphatase family metal-dependent hydrolase
MGGVTTSGKNETPTLQGCMHWWRLLSSALLVATMVLASLLVLVAQSHYLIAPLAYMPHVFVGPALLVLAIPGWRWERRRAILLASSAFIFHFLVLGWKIPAAQNSPSQDLRVAFVNRGDQDHASWTRWIQNQRPDLIGLTDVRSKDGPSLGVGLPVVAGLPFLMRIGEHALASRYPFRGSQVVRPDPPPHSPFLIKYLPAARFEVDAPGGPVVVYLVHLRSPRDALSKYRSPRLWRWTLFGVPKHVSPSITLDHYWKEQHIVLEGLLRRVEAETLPTLVLGDFNLPDFGPRYRRLTQNLQDAHIAAGRGFGHTFPGDLSLWAAFGRPWMRIDYILTDPRHWRVEECLVQSAADAVRSQHRALLARLSRLP